MTMPKPPRRSPPKRAGKAGAEFREASRRLRAFALNFPGAVEDFPWGERVAKAGGKIFVALGLDPVPGGPMSLTVKLPVSGSEALDLPFTRPTGYGLGKAGWVTATFQPGDRPPVGILEGWILESFRAVAPKKLSAQLDLETPPSRARGRRVGRRSGRKPALERRRFEAMLESGHKGAALIVPFDPGEVWRSKPVTVSSPVYGKRPGHLVTGTLNRRPFEGWIGHRWGRFFILVDETLRRSVGISIGDRVEVVVEPR